MFGCLHDSRIDEIKIDVVVFFAEHLKSSSVSVTEPIIPFTRRLTSAKIPPRKFYESYVKISKNSLVFSKVLLKRLYSTPLIQPSSERDKVGVYPRILNIYLALQDN